jgi:tetrathionate reductase subunit B
MKKQPDTTRRRFLTGAAAAAGLTLAPGVVLVSPAEARAPGQPASARERWGLLIDLNKLDEATCNACVDACKTENGWEGSGKPETDPQWIRTVKVSSPQTGATKFVPVMCQHCSNATCVDVCPTAASFKRADGIVLVDKHRCIGCRYCMMACPYKARSFVFEPVEGQKHHAPRGMGTVEACNMCVNRIDAGGIPACVEAANKAAPGAIVFGDLLDRKSEISMQVAKYATSRIRGDLGLEPGVLYRGL